MDEKRSSIELRPVPDKNEDEANVVTFEGAGSWLQARYLVVLAAFAANAVGYVMRVNLSVAIVAMTLDSNSTNTSLAQDIPTYEWDEATRSAILSSFFWGYVITQIPSGYLAQRFGPRILLFVLLLVCSLATILFVPASAMGWQYACASRVILGLAQGGLLPCSHALLARWAPPNERGRMSVYTYSGQPLGTVFALSGAGLLASTSTGWPTVFYVSGGAGLVCAALWLWLVADTPAQHRLATPFERHYIESSISGATTNDKQQEKQRLVTPWRAILTSGPMWSLIIVHSVQNWGFWTLLTQIPSYMSGVLNFELKKNGLLSALPYLVMWLAGLALSWASDFMLKRKCYSVGVSRKLGNSLAHYGSAVSLIILGYMSADETAAVAILTLAVAFNAGTMIGYQVNHIDLSPNFAGTMMGITNCIGNLFSIVGPLVVGLIVTENDNAAQWRLVFLIAAGFYIVGNSIFVIFGSGEVQPWNNPEWVQAKNKSDSDLSSSVSTEKNNP